MKILKGKSVFAGIAIGKIFILKKRDVRVTCRHVLDPEEEIRRVEAAKEKAVAQLSDLSQRTREEAGQAEADIFEVHQMMLSGGEYLETIFRTIRSDKVNGEYAVQKAGEHFADMFARMNDDYMRARSADIHDITDRLVRILLDAQEEPDLPKEPVILAAQELSPSETVQLDKSRILAFVTEKGSKNSHSAILARIMNIPALMGISLTEEMNGMKAVVDGEKGQLILQPDPDTEKYFEGLMERERQERQSLKELKGLPTCTRGGRNIHLYGNIGRVEDVEEVLSNGGEGIGLFRSEFLYLEKESFPTEEEQLEAYREAAARMEGKKVIIRTLDIGADKRMGFLPMEQEENPALGLRGIRVCLEYPDMFKTQLRAILRAGIYGKLAVMYPMVISLEEIRRCKALFREARQELEDQGLPYGKDIEQGIMVETPAAVMLSDLLAEEVDFFSIGTNDLTQYTLAIDRQNPNLEKCCDPRHEAVLRMIRLVTQNAHRAGIWVGVCGELAADTALTSELVKIGVDEFSVAPSMILAVRKAVRELE